jgi:hypothetical protein
MSIIILSYEFLFLLQPDNGKIVDFNLLVNDDDALFKKKKWTILSTRFLSKFSCVMIMEHEFIPSHTPEVWVKLDRIGMLHSLFTSSERKMSIYRCLSLLCFLLFQLWDISATSGSSNSILQMPPTGFWMIRERSYGLVCAMIQFSGVFQIRYLTRHLTFKTSNLNIKPDAVFSSGSLQGHLCVTDSQGIIHFDLEFDSSRGETTDQAIDDNTLMLFFQNDDNSYELLGLALEYTINNETFPDHILGDGTVMFAEAVFDGGDLLIPQGKSYSCRAKQSIQFEGIDGVSFILHDFKFEAFNFQRNSIFSPSLSCPLDYSFMGFDWATILVALGIVLISLSCMTASFVVFRRWRTLSRRNSTNHLSGNTRTFPRKQVAFNISENV